MYLFYKVVFLAVLFLPWYKGAHYIYRSHLRQAFRAYEGILYNFSLTVIEKIKEEIFIDKPKEQKNISSDEEEPIDSTPDESENENSVEEEEKKKEPIKTFQKRNSIRKYFQEKKQNLKKSNYS